MEDKICKYCTGPVDDRTALINDDDGYVYIDGNGKLDLSNSDDVLDCVSCQSLYKMPYDFCCLLECGEHEFCLDCNKGIYFKERKLTYA